MDEAFAAEVRAIRWFSAVGEPISTSFGLSISAVSDQQQALESCTQATWENATLEARNRLSEFLCIHYRERDRQWNAITGTAKARIIKPLLTEVWEPFARQRGLGKVFLDCVSWDVLAAVMEHEYQDCNGRPVFFLHLLDVYRSGHFPCGWEGEWPAGRLLVW